MNDTSLALKYLTRKKSRTLFVFLIFTIVNTLVFSIISIRNGANSALSDLTPEVQNYFYLGSKEILDPDTAVSEGSSISFSSSAHPIDQEIINKISQIDSVKQYACQYGALGADAITEEKAPLNLVYYHTPPTEDDFSDIQGVTDSEAFCEGKLIEGTHITPAVSYVALISTEYAALNDLKIGDKILLNTKSDASNQEVSVKVSISGLYEALNESDDKNLLPSELYANRIYVDYNTAADLDTASLGTTSVKFFVQSAEQLDAVLTQVKNLEIDWQQYELIDDADIPLIDLNSIESVSTLFTLLIWATILVGLLIITFVLILQVRMRTAEMGIQLSLGYPKGRIIRQHCLEAMMPALFAMVISYFIAKIILGHSVFAGGLYTPLLRPIVVLELLLINLILIIISTFLSSIRLLRTKPRDIFSNLD